MCVVLVVGIWSFRRKVPLLFLLPTHFQILQRAWTFKGLRIFQTCLPPGIFLDETVCSCWHTKHKEENGVWPVPCSLVSPYNWSGLGYSLPLMVWNLVQGKLAFQGTHKSQGISSSGCTLSAVWGRGRRLPPPPTCIPSWGRGRDWEACQQ